MISNQLENRVLFRWKDDKRLSCEYQSLVDKAVRKLVLLMKAYETHGIADRETIERAVIHAFETCEKRYYCFNNEEVMAVIEMETRNEKGRRKHY